MLKNKQEFKIFRSELDVALEPLMKKYNFTLKQGTITYDATKLSMKITIKDNSGLSIKENEKKEFEDLCWRLGLESSDYKKTFTVNGENFELVGIKPKANKYPLIGEAVDGKRYNFALDVFKEYDKYHFQI